MKKTIIGSSLFIFTSLMLMLSSCKPTPTTSKDNKIVFDSIVFAENIQLVEVNDTTMPHAEVNINFSYPSKFRSKEDLARLQQIFIGTFFSNVHLDNLSPQEALDEYIDEYKEEYQSLSNIYYEEVQRLAADDHLPMWYWYSLNIENNIMHESDSLLSYAVEYSDYSGGAHGSYRVTYTNIDLDELVTVSEEDIFVPNYTQKLAEIIVNRLMVQNEVTTREELIEKGFFNVDEIFPNNNFWISDEGLHYAFNQYEIAPYVMGVIEVYIPFDDLKDILKTENGIEKLVSVDF